MTIEGAIIKEQGITFGIIIVKKTVMTTTTEVEKARRSFQSSLSEFRDIPLILATQDSRGRFKYQGRRDIVNFLAPINPARIPWTQYRYS